MRIYLDTEFTGLHQATTLISIGLEDQTGKKLYAEFTDYDESQVDPWLQENILDKLILNDVELTVLDGDIREILSEALGKDSETDSPSWIAAFNEKGEEYDSIQEKSYFEDVSEFRFKGTKKRFVEILKVWLAARDIEEGEKIELWSDCQHYDMVLFMELFGGAMKLPSSVYYIPFDICTLFKERGIDPDINRESFVFTELNEIYRDGFNSKKHNAGWDATVIRLCHEKLMEMAREERDDIVTGMAENFKLTAEQYITLFEEKHTTKFEFWVGDRIGDVAHFECLGFFSYEDIRYDINHDIPVANASVYQDVLMEGYYISYETYCLYGTNNQEPKEMPGDYNIRTIEKIARACHEANRAYCISIGDDSQLPYDEAPGWQRKSAINGVQYHLENPNSSPEDSHKSWLAEKEADGWVYGAVKNPTIKEHPCMVPYAELPEEQQFKDHLFVSIVKSFL